FFIVWTLFSFSFGSLVRGRFEEPLIKEAVERASQFVFICTELLPEHLMIAEGTIESSPDAALLFQSRFRMAILHSEGRAYKRIQWIPDLVSDDRSGRKTHVPYANMANVLMVSFEGKTYHVRDNGKLFGKISPTYWHSIFVPETEPIPLFNWPMHIITSFKMRDQNNLPAIRFGNRFRCIDAKRLKNGRLQSFWILDGKAPGCNVYEFEEDLLVYSEVRSHGTLFESTEKIPNVEEMKWTSKVSTKWNSLRLGDVPKEVTASYRVNPWGEPSTIDLKAVIHVYDTTEEKFQQGDAELKRIISEIKIAEEKGEVRR
ncbi:MAG: hypothetical protein ABL921_34370, partial [Pirellula sp.]